MDVYPTPRALHLPLILNYLLDLRLAWSLELKVWSPHRLVQIRSVVLQYPNEQLEVRSVTKHDHMGGSTPTFSYTAASTLGPFHRYEARAG